MRIDVAIIGGGVSGLAAAYELRKRGRKVVVLERQARPGGNAVSERIDGFLMEHGPSTVAATAQDALRIAGELGLDDDRRELSSDVKQRYLVGGGRLQGIPTGPTGFLRSNYMSVPGRLRLMVEGLVPRGKNVANETVADFCARRFGREFTERVMDPLIAGIYAGRADELSVAAVFSKLVDLEQKYGSVTRGMAARVREGARMPGSRFFSWRDGVGSLPRALASALGEDLQTNVAVLGLERSGDGFELETTAGKISAKAVIVATQPHVAAQLLEGVDAEATDALGGIAAPPMAVAFLGYRKVDVEHPMDGLGFLSAQSERRTLNGAQFTSTMFADRAPEGFVSISCYFGGARRPELAACSADELIHLARTELFDLLGARGEPVISKVRHWPRGLPAYELGHTDKVEQLKTLSDRQPGLFITGNHMTGVSVEMCTALANKTAAGVDYYLANMAGNAEPIEANPRVGTA